MNGRPSSRALIVDATTMVTAVGADATTSTAAARAGLRRARPLEEMPLVTADTGDEMFGIGHPADWLNKGFEGEARTVRLLHAALTDIVWQRWGDASSLPEDVPLFLSVPNPRRRYSRRDLLSSDAERDASVRAEAESEEDLDGGKRAAGTLSAATRLLGWTKPPPIAFVADSGNVGFIEAMSAAHAALAAGECRLALVGGYDSLLDLDTLSWLQSTGRLKTPDNPIGVEPGEGAAFCLVRLDRGPKGPTPDPKPRARVDGATVADVKEDQDPAATLVDLLLARTQGASSPPWLVSDQSGAPDDAAEIGMILVGARAKGIHSGAVTLPAFSFGDVGAAAAAVGATLSIDAWKRRWAPARECLIMGRSEGKRGLLALRASD